MTYKEELKKGKKVEREHKDTYKILQKKKSQQYEDYILYGDKERDDEISRNKFYESIAKDHLKEDKNYYTKLKKAKL
jgi:hypothetical protein